MHRNEAKRSYYYPFELDEVSNALNLPGGHNEAQELQKACAAEGATEIQWRAAEISRRLQGENSRVGKRGNTPPRPTPVLECPPDVAFT